MSWMRWVALAALTVTVGTGCTATTILNASFDGLSGSPQGSIPGAPDDDHISIDAGSPSMQVGDLVFQHPPADRLFFSSREVKKADSTRTIQWTGKRTTQQNEPFAVDISALNGVGINPPESPLTLKILKSGAELRFHDGTLAHSAPLVTNGEHTVFISLRLGSGTYAVSIKQPNTAEIAWSGNLPSATTNWIKSKSRMHVRAGFPSTGGTPNSVYRMYSILMREK